MKTTNSPKDDPVLDLSEKAFLADFYANNLEGGAPDTDAAWERSMELGDAFADAIPTSPAGAITKLREILKNDNNDFENQSHTLWTPRHIRGVILYLQSLSVGGAFSV